MVLYDAALSHSLRTFKFIKMGKISLNCCSPLCLALKHRKEWRPPDVFSGNGTNCCTKDVGV